MQNIWLGHVHMALQMLGFYTPNRSLSGMAAKIGIMTFLFLYVFAEGMTSEGWANDLLDEKIGPDVFLTVFPAQCGHL